jgi:hypothetical protein
MAMVLHYKGEKKASEALPRCRADKGNGYGARRCNGRRLHVLRVEARENRGNWLGGPAQHKLMWPRASFKMELDRT